MSKKSLTLVVVTVLLLASTALGTTPAWAGGVNSLIKDAQDGVVNGNYSASTVRAALAMVRGDPAYAQYSDIEGVLVDYLASISHTSKPTATPTPTNTNGGTSSHGTATPTGTANPSSSPNKTKSPSPYHSSPGASATGTTSPPPSTGSSGQAASRLGAIWWLFALAAGGLVVGVVIVRRRSR